MAHEDLQTYLNDHLAGSLMALKVLDRLVAGCEDVADRQFFADLQREIEEDRSVVVRLMERVEGRPGALRQAGAWGAELLAQVKLRLDDPGGNRLAYFEALEGLSLGILGKRALWRALAATARQVPAVGGEDYDRLIARADDQHTRVETRRLAAAPLLFHRG